MVFALRIGEWSNSLMKDLKAQEWQFYATLVLIYGDDISVTITYINKEGSFGQQCLISHRDHKWCMKEAISGYESSNYPTRMYQSFVTQRTLYPNKVIQNYWTWCNNFKLKTSSMTGLQADFTRCITSQDLNCFNNAKATMTYRNCVYPELLTSETSGEPFRYTANFPRMQYRHSHYKDMAIMKLLSWYKNSYTGKMTYCYIHTAPWLWSKKEISTHNGWYCIMNEDRPGNFNNYITL